MQNYRKELLWGIIDGASHRLTPKFHEDRGYDKFMGMFFGTPSFARFRGGRGVGILLKTETEYAKL